MRTGRVAPVGNFWASGIYRGRQPEASDLCWPSIFLEKSHYFNVLWLSPVVPATPRRRLSAAPKGACSRKLNRDDSWPSRFAPSIAALARTQKESRDEAHPADPVPPPAPEARRRQRLDGAGRSRDAA